MKLGFHYHIPAVLQENKIWIPGYLGCFIDGLAERCSEVILFLHSPNQYQRELLDYAIRQPNVKLVNIGPYTSVPKRLLQAARYTKPVKAWRDQLNVMLIRGPSPLLPHMAASLGNLPIALLLVGDNRLGIEASAQPRWRKAIIRLMWEWNHRQQLSLIKKKLTFVNSRKLYESYKSSCPNLVEVRTTTLSARDFYQRSDTCQGRPVRLLYTGRLSREKGLLDMVSAVNILREKGLDVELQLVGWSEKDDTIVEEVAAKAAHLGVEKSIHFMGYRKLGPELFQCYQEADIYLIASILEGFPRTIWEAMASSLPVIATSVGSIPDFVQEAAVIVPPSNPQAMADAVHSLVDNQELRMRLIKKGLKLAKENTLEIQSANIFDSITTWLASDT